MIPRIYRSEERFDKMLQRTITSAVILIALIPLIIFSEYIIYPITLSVLALVAVYELLGVMEVRKKKGVALPAYIIALSYPTIAYFVDRDSAFAYLLSLAATLMVYMFYLMGVSVFSKGKTPFSKISEVFISVTYVVVSFSSLSLARYLNAEVGVYEIALVFIVAWVCDVCAYLVGSIFGKHKLIPEISPKKTVEGAVGGTLFALLAFLLYGFILDTVVADMTVDYFFLAIFGLLLPIVSQLGDLVASLIKREYGVKDYGRIFPGHGGVMDRFDSVLSVSTILLILCVLCPPFSMT